jgi:polyketide cyclase/dehydrase/lipid transport protein
LKQIEAAHRYDIPVEQGFAFITDPANWPSYWPGFVRLQPGFHWAAVGDTARLVTRLLGRERELVMTITAFEPNRLVGYRSVQAGLPNVDHERAFTADGDGFVYRLVVAYEPRPGLAGVFDRVVLPRAIRRAFADTFLALERELRSGGGSANDGTVGGRSSPHRAG